MEEGARPTPPVRRVRMPTPQVALAVLTALVVGTLLYLGGDALGPFVLGLLVAYILDPVVTFLNRRLRLPRWIGILALYVLIVAVLVLVGRITILALVEQLADFVDQLPELLRQWVGALQEFVAGLAWLSEEVRAEIALQLDELVASLTGEGPRPGLDELLGFLQIFQFAGPIARVATSVVAYFVIPIFVFYLLKDRPTLVAGALDSLPETWRADARALGRVIERVFGRWLRGQLLLGVVVGVATFVGLELLGIFVDPVFTRFAVFLAIIAGVLELVPIIGPIIAAIPALILGATGGLDAAIAVLLLYLLVQQLENNFLVPKIQGDAVDLHPSAVLFVIVLGGALGGLLGAILAIPVTATGRDVLRYLFMRLAPEPVPVSEAETRALRPAAWRRAQAAAAAAEAGGTTGGDEPPEAGADATPPDPERPGGS
ncbi:MAG TPA: AI-2E family transporter [Candidatus Limnocylindrales bacterium]|nr:AI-2E family transporter [Candidatus Limnocylindrales bacterium]